MIKWVCFGYKDERFRISDEAISVEVTGRYTLSAAGWREGPNGSRRLIRTGTCKASLGESDPLALMLEPVSVIRAHYI